MATRAEGLFNLTMRLMFPGWTAPCLMHLDRALRLSLAMESGTRRGEAGEQICTASALGVEGAGIDGDSTLHIYDVVEQWRRLTDLPAVLAITVTRRRHSSTDRSMNCVSQTKPSA